MRDKRYECSWRRTQRQGIRYERMAEVLAESEKRGRLLFEGTINGVALLELVSDNLGNPLDIRFLEINPALESLIGATSKEVTGRSFVQIFPDIEPYWMEKLGEVALSGNPFTPSNFFSTLDRHFNITAFSLNHGIFYVVFSDITEIKKIEDELSTYRDHLEILVHERTVQLTATNEQLFAEIVQRKKAEESQERLVRSVTKRLNELSCLYSLSMLLGTSPLSLSELFCEAVGRLPPAWQYPEITRSRILFDGREFLSGSFCLTPWLQSADIVVSGEKVGVVQVYYAEERPEADEGPFLKGERDLIDNLARMFGDALSRNYLEEVLRAKHCELNALAVELTFVEEKQRRRIASQLHDQVGQNLLLGMIKLSVLAADLATQSNDHLFEEIKGLLGRSIEDVRSLTIELSPPFLDDVGLQTALEWLGKQVEHDYGLRVIFRGVGGQQPLSEEVRSTVYLSVRELLINAAKHAETTSVRLWVKTAHQVIFVMVADKGVGFVSANSGLTFSRNGGFGLQNMRRRIEYLGGTLKVISAPGSGTRIRLRVPVAVKGG